MVPPADISAYWTLEARKYDRRLHYTLPATLVAAGEEWLWLRSVPGGEIVHHTRGTKTIMVPSDMIFWRGRWYNVYLNYHPDGTLRHYYCNIGLPPVITPRRLSFVDLDLDLQIEPDGAMSVLDEDEFAAHAVAFNYPPEVQRAAWAALAGLALRWHTRRWPFGGLGEGPREA